MDPGSRRKRNFRKAEKCPPFLSRRPRQCLRKAGCNGEGRPWTGGGGDPRPGGAGSGAASGPGRPPRGTAEKRVPRRRADGAGAGPRRRVRPPSASPAASARSGPLEAPGQPRIGVKGGGLGGPRRAIADFPGGRPPRGWAPFVRAAASGGRRLTGEGRQVAVARRRRFGGQPP